MYICYYADLENGCCNHQILLHPRSIQLCKAKTSLITDSNTPQKELYNQNPRSTVSFCLYQKFSLGNKICIWYPRMYPSPKLYGNYAISKLIFPVAQGKLIFETRKKQEQNSLFKSIGWFTTLIKTFKLQKVPNTVNSWTASIGLHWEANVSRSWFSGKIYSTLSISISSTQSRTLVSPCMPS